MATENEVLENDGSVEDPYDKLRKDYAAEKAARERAEREAHEVRVQNSQLQGEQLQNHKTVINHALMSAKAELDNAKRVYAVAMAEQDYETAANAQADIAAAISEAQRLQAGAIELEQRKPPQVPAAPAKTPTIEDKLQAFSQKTQRWLRDHPEILTDPNKWRIAASHHQIATTQHGMDPESDEYFSFIEDSMGYGDRDIETKPTRRAQVSAPPSRSGGTGRDTGGSRTVKLSASERDHAAAMGMSDEDYGKAKLKIRNGQAGKLRYSSELRGGNSQYDN
jgi:hypothetical protein